MLLPIFFSFIFHSAWTLGRKSAVKERERQKLLSALATKKPPLPPPPDIGAGTAAAGNGNGNGTTTSGLTNTGSTSNGKDLTSAAVSIVAAGNGLKRKESKTTSTAKEDDDDDEDHNEVSSSGAGGGLTGNHRPTYMNGGGDHGVAAAAACAAAAAAASATFQMPNNNNNHVNKDGCKPGGFESKTSLRSHSPKDNAAIPGSSRNMPIIHDQFSCNAMINANHNFWGSASIVDEKLQMTLNSIPVMTAAVGTRTLPPPSRYRDGFKPYPTTSGPQLPPVVPPPPPLFSSSQPRQQRSRGGMSCHHRSSSRTLPRNLSRFDPRDLRRSRSEPYSAHLRPLPINYCNYGGGRGRGAPDQGLSDTPSASPVSPASTLTPPSSANESGGRGHSPTSFMPLRPQSLDIFYATVRPRKPAAVAAAGLYNSRNQPYQKPPVMAPAAAPPPPSGGGGGGSSDVASGADTGGVVDLNRILPPPHDSLFSSSKNNQTGSNSFQNKNAGKKLGKCGKSIFGGQERTPSLCR